MHAHAKQLIINKIKCMEINIFYVSILIVIYNIPPTYATTDDIYDVQSLTKGQRSSVLHQHKIIHL
jgi:hypothetical protein